MRRFRVRSRISVSRNMMTYLFGLSVLIPAMTFSAQPAKKAVSWDDWQFLLGEWIGERGGQPGQGIGTFAFSLELQNTILVRKNHAEYPATKDRPAFSHDDLMVVHQEAGKPTQAIYFDNEGHVINYTVGFSEDKNGVTFLSELMPSAPRFKLTYTKGEKDTVLIKFEIASPGKPEEFSPYLEAKAKRK